MFWYGPWRSLVAHYTGGVGVAGSNPVGPTIFRRGGIRLPNRQPPRQPLTHAIPFPAGDRRASVTGRTNPPRPKSRIEPHADFGNNCPMNQLPEQPSPLPGLDSARLCRHAKGSFWGGIVSILIGLSAIALPGLFTMGIELFIGALLTVAGISQIFAALSSVGSKHWWLALLTGILTSGGRGAVSPEPLPGCGGADGGFWSALFGQRVFPTVLRLPTSGRRRSGMGDLQRGYRHCTRSPDPRRMAGHLDVHPRTFSWNRPPLFRFFPDRFRSGLPTGRRRIGPVRA